MNLLTKSDFQIKKKSGPRNNRERLIELSAKLVDKPYKQIASLLKDWPEQWIEQVYAFCVDAPNPAAYWWTLYKKSKVDKVTRQK